MTATEDVIVEEPTVMRVSAGTAEIVVDAARATTDETAGVRNVALAMTDEETKDVLSAALATTDDEEAGFLSAALVSTDEERGKFYARI
jgi:hypothetical protein